MAKFTYMIEETLRRYVTVEAEDAMTARAIVQKRYDDEEIVLTADDFFEYGIYIDSVDYGTDNEN